MKVTAENLENCRVALSIEAEADELDKSLDEAYQHLVKEVSVPGFRKGKAPRTILEQHVGKGYLLEEALEHLIPQLYEQAVESQKLEPIARPEIEVSQTEPVSFKAVVSLKPEIKLGDYRNLKVETSPPAEITEQEIAAALKEFQEGQGAWIPVERAAELGDLVVMDIQASVDGKPWLNHKSILYEMDKDSRSPVPGFASQLQGIAKDKEKSFSLTVPLDYPIEGMRGKEGTFQVTVSEVKEKQLPELNDELAKGAGYDSLEDMKKKVNDDLKARAEVRSRLELSRKALDGLVEVSEVKYPPVLEDEEISELLRDQARRLGFRELTDYLKKANRKEEEIREELRPIAKKRLTESLILGKLAEEEKIEISSSEVDDKIVEMTKGSEDKEKTKEFFSLPQIRQSIEQSLRTQKTLDQLLQIAVGSTENTTKGE